MRRTGPLRERSGPLFMPARRRHRVQQVDPGPGDGSAAVIAIASASARTQPVGLRDRCPELGASTTARTGRAHPGPDRRAGSISEGDGDPARCAQLRRAELSRVSAGPARRQSRFSSSRRRNNNQFECTASTRRLGDGAEQLPDRAVVIRHRNNATCTEKIGDPTGPQSCTIFQLNTSGANNATVVQQVAAGTGTTQDAAQSTVIGQWDGSGSNSAARDPDAEGVADGNARRGELDHAAAGRPPDRRRESALRHAATTRPESTSRSSSRSSPRVEPRSRSSRTRQPGATTRARRSTRTRIRTRGTPYSTGTNSASITQNERPLRERLDERHAHADPGRPEQRAVRPHRPAEPGHLDLQYGSDREPEPRCERRADRERRLQGAAAGRASACSRTRATA